MFYTHGALDRADHLRRDPKRLTSLRDATDTRLVPVWRGTVLVSSDSDKQGPRMVTLPSSASLPENDPIWLGFVDDTAYFAINCASLDSVENVAAQATSRAGASLAAEFADLRIAGPQLPANEGALLAFARGMVYWQEHCRFCTRCGHRLESRDGGHVKRCNNPDCRHLAFPRTDPAVIMLVTHPATGELPERCLLGRSPAWPEGVFSTLAGFVEPGESLEQAVQREVYEEAGIETTDVRYIASQPWPFPRSIMLGFEAIATHTTISIDPQELAAAEWFSRDELGTFGNWGDDAYARQLPRADSIARYLINGWLARID